MPTPSSLFASAILLSLLKLAGIKHPPPHPFSSHSFSIPLPHLHGVSRVHAILHSFAYPLKPLTQAFISIQPTKPVSLSKFSPTFGILPKKCHIALSPLHTQTVSLATRDIAHSTRKRILSGRHSTFSRCLAFGILSSRRSTFFGYLTSRILSGQRSTFSGYLTSGILSDQRPTFSGYLASGILSGRRSILSGYFTSGA